MATVSLRQKKAYLEHRAHIKKAKPLVDSSTPRGLKNNPFLGNNPETRFTAQRKIDQANEAMVERMAEIMRRGVKVSASRRNSPKRYQNKLKEAGRQREKLRIEKENKELVHRLKTRVKSGVPSAKELAAEYAKKSRVRAKMSEAAQRAERTVRAREAEERRRTLREMRDRASVGGAAGTSILGASTGPECSDVEVGAGDEFSSRLMYGNGLLRQGGVVSAKRIRETVAAQRGETLPTWLTSTLPVHRPPNAGRRVHSTGERKIPAARDHSGTISMSHNGAGSPLKHPAFPF